MTSKQTSLFAINNEVCRVCSHFKKVETRFYCEYYQAFLEPETLTIDCDFFAKPKKTGGN